MNYKRLVKLCNAAYGNEKDIISDHSKNFGNDYVIVKICDGEGVIAIRGSDAEKKDWFGRFGNMRFKSIKTPYGRAHRGFYRSAERMSGWVSDIIEMYQDVRKWTITGHSRGGAIGQALQRQLVQDCKLVTFGSPRVWKKRVNLKGYHVRIHNDGDSITNTPPRIFGFRHYESKEIELPGKWFKGDHPIDEYIDRLKGECEIEMRRR